MSVRETLVKKISGILMLCGMALCSSAAMAGPGSTTTDQDKRESQLSDKKCATTYKRLQNVLKYIPVPDVGSDQEKYAYIRDAQGHLGILTYDMLGDIYYRGCLKAKLEPDKEAAAFWYQVAAIRHVPESQWKLGKMLVEGDGIPQDNEMGMAWVSSAAIEGSTQAASYLTAAGEPMPPVNIPNTFTVVRDAYVDQLDAQRAIERQQFLSDLLGFVAQVGVGYVAAKSQGPSPVIASSNDAGSRSTENIRSNSHNPFTTYKPVNNTKTSPYQRYIDDRPLRMYTPTYCSSYATASPIGETVYVRVSTFCN